jgi:hypothetical protein
MRPIRLAAISLFACSMCCATSVRADDATPPGKTPDAGAKQPGADAKKDEAQTRIERAKSLVKEIEDAVARAKAAQPVDTQLLQKLLAALDQAKALVQPAKPAELTPEEKKAVVDEAKKQGGGGDAPKDPQSDWAEKMLGRALAGADLTEEESVKAKAIISDWWKENTAAMGDGKKQSDLKRKRDDDLDKAIGQKKAQKVINNLNSMGPGRKG